MQRIIDKGYGVQSETSLSLEEIRKVYDRPEENTLVLARTIRLATGQISGSMAGYQQEGITLEITNIHGDPIQTVTTQSDGTYSFKGLEEGTWQIHPQQKGYTFRPENVRVQLANNQRLKGFDFTSYLYLDGSHKVPSPNVVLAGTTYIDSDGETELRGELNIETPLPDDVVKGSHYTGADGVLQEGAVIIPEEKSVLKGTRFGARGEKVGVAETNILIRSPAEGKGSTSRFKVQYY